jgi:hypothetical protein
VTYCRPAVAPGFSDYHGSSLAIAVERQYFWVGTPNTMPPDYREAVSTMSLSKGFPTSGSFVSIVSVVYRAQASR